MEKAASFLSSILGGGGGAASPEPAATVKSILVYPIKSCRGIAVPQATITDTGIHGTPFLHSLDLPPTFHGKIASFFLPASSIARLH
jgi:hypothetical protein